MSNVKRVSVALTAELRAMLDEAVASGDYSSTDEVVRDALRVWRARRGLDEIEIEELRRLWREGLASGPSLDAEVVLERLRQKYAAQASPAG